MEKARKEKKRIIRQTFVFLSFSLDERTRMKKELILGLFVLCIVSLLPVPLFSKQTPWQACSSSREMPKILTCDVNIIYGDDIDHEERKNKDLSCVANSSYWAIHKNDNKGYMWHK